MAVKKKSGISRRSFLGRAAAAAVGCSVMPAHLALGKPAADRVRFACVGCGGRAGSDVRGLIGNNAEPVAFCDVDPGRGGIAKWKKQYPQASVFKDFRLMLDKVEKDVDAVCIGTPDHTHFVAAMDAMRRGKHVYVEKPLTHTFREAELLIQAEKKFGVVTQMGNQGHTSASADQFKRMAANGIVDDVVRIDAWKRQRLWFMDKRKRIKDFPPEEPKPDSLDWDLWCGPAEVKPFSKLYHPFSWRGFYLYGTGMFGDWGAHLIDMAHDYLKLGLPTSIKAVRVNDHNRVIFPLASHIHMKFPARGPGLPECDLHWRDGEGYWEVWGDDGPVKKQYYNKNKKGELEKPRLGHAGTLLTRKQGDYLILRGSHSNSSITLPHDKRNDFGDKFKGKSPGNHHKGFVEACKGNGKTWSPFRVSGVLTQVLLLGAASQYMNTDLEFDPRTKRFTNNRDANALLDGPPPRRGYEDYYRPL
ncbi:MAG: Gfo/Idh/MocA family protein [Planctomycetota bacterium]|jgi:predicted dehydrogenase